MPGRLNHWELQVNVRLFRGLPLRGGRCRDNYTIEGMLTENAYHILAVNPGSTSTKVALFVNDRELDGYEIEKKHRSGLAGEALRAEIALYLQEIRAWINRHPGLRIDAVVGRGGFINRKQFRISSGVYAVAVIEHGEVRICNDIVRGVTEEPELDHASNLGIPIAAALAQEFRVPAYTVDPVVADDFSDVARLSGYAPIERRSTAHALSVRMLGIKAAAQLGKDISDTNLVAVHMGGGITVAALRGGKLVDNNIALLGGGPFTPQRVGSLPMKALIDLCFSGKYTQEELQVELTKQGGLRSYLHEDNAKVIGERIEQGDRFAEQVMRGMAYQIAKEIGAMAIAAGGMIDAVVLSGGLSRSELLLSYLKEWVGHIAPLIVFPGTVEMEAMASGAWRVLTGREMLQYYVLDMR